MKEDIKNEAMNNEAEQNEAKKKFFNFDNILEKIGVERYEEEVDDDEENPAEEPKKEEVQPEVKPQANKQPAKKTTPSSPKKDTPAQSEAKSGGNMTTNNYEGTAAQMKVFTPAAVGEVRDVCDELRSGHAVIVNTDKLNDADYCRFYDFVYGAAYMVDGKVSQISDTVLILTPASIDITNAVKDEEPQTEEDIDDFFGDDDVIDADEIDDLEL